MKTAFYRMKAILIIDDMPIKCEGCPLHYRKRQEIYRCEMTHKNIKLSSKPLWCPLRPMPDQAAETLINGLDLIKKMGSIEVKKIIRTE